MIEVPAAALIARHLSQRADFLSVGTNDLIQYTLAVDRGEPHLAYLANATDPAILKLLKMVSTEASAAHIPASVCGAMASDPLAAVLLIGLGFRDLSLEASAIASVKAALRRVDVAEAREVADEAGELASVAAVDALLLGRFEQRLRDVLELD
jgi:phosphoenolpyruvate-protein phosphotransferase (PTS system enzyme I)